MKGMPKTFYGLMTGEIPEEIPIWHCMVCEFHKGCNGTVATKNTCDFRRSKMPKMLV